MQDIKNTNKTLVFHTRQEFWKWHQPGSVVTQCTWTAIPDGEIMCIFLERRKFEERTRWKRRVSKTLVLCRGRFRSESVPNSQNQSDLQSKVSNRFWTPCAKCTACAKCSELGVQIRGWCTFSRLRLTGECCLRIRIRWRSMVRCTFSRVLIFAGTPGQWPAAVS